MSMTRHHDMHSFSAEERSTQSSHGVAEEREGTGERGTGERGKVLRSWRHSSWAFQARPDSMSDVGMAVDPFIRVTIAHVIRLKLSFVSGVDTHTTTP